MYSRVKSDRARTRFNKMQNYYREPRTRALRCFLCNFCVMHFTHGKIENMRAACSLRCGDVFHFSDITLFNTVLDAFTVMFAACMVNFATETVMQLCHGKRRCSVVANSTTFGDPCKPDSRTYLKVVYTCGESVEIFLHSAALYHLFANGIAKYGTFSLMQMTSNDPSSKA